MANSTIVSVFSSIQGEGLYAGKPHLFIRFAECNLRCAYCDTPEGLKIPRYCRMEKTPFSKPNIKQLNPVTKAQLSNIIKRLTRRFPDYHAIALTGGEPLLQSDFLHDWLPAIRRLKIPILLETNGTLLERLEKIAGLIDIVSMDIKLPSDYKGLDRPWSRARRFIKTALQNRLDIYAKVVLTRNTKICDLRKAAGLLAGINRTIPVVLQPASAVRKGIKTPNLKQIIQAHIIFTRLCRDVRIIPQIHRIMGWR